MFTIYFSELSPRDRLSIVIQYKSRLLGRVRKRTLPITVKQSIVVKEARDDAQGNKSELHMDLA